MARIGETAASKVLELLTARPGLNGNVAALALPEISERQVVPQNISFELAERSTQTKYPAVHVYCEKLANLLKEKFRTFSGKAHMVVELRLSQDRLQGLEQNLQTYADAVMQLLDQNRGDWGQGMYYTGGYEAAFGPVKHGGLNFIQIARITFEVGVSVN